MESNIPASRLAAETRVSGGTISKILHRSEYDPSYTTMKALFDAVYAIIGEKPSTVEDLLISKSRKFPRDPPVTAAKENDSVASVKKTMDSTGYSQLPVVVNGKVTGMVSIRSLLDHPDALIANQALVYDYAMIELSMAKSQAKELVKMVNHDALPCDCDRAPRPMRVSRVKMLSCIEGLRWSVFAIHRGGRESLVGGHMRRLGAWRRERPEKG